MTTLVRLTVVAPRRRIDLAVPEPVPVAELLPDLLRHAGETGATGWRLRRADGTALDDALPLGAQQVADGAVLHLVPADLQWPEVEYDDLVAAIADGAARTGRAWSARHTRVAGLAGAAVSVALALAVITRTGAPWYTPAALTGGLLLAGTLLARVVGDAGAGAVLAGLALPAAFLSGLSIADGGGTVAQGLSLGDGGLSAGPVLNGCSALLVAAVLGALGAVDRPGLFAAGVTVALGGGAAATAIAAGWADLEAAAATGVAGFLLFSPLTGPLAVRLARLPLPVLPRTAAELVRPEPQPPRAAVEAAVRRADALLTGVLAGGAALSAGALLVGAAHPGHPGPLGLVRFFFLGLVSLGFGLRARLYPAVRHRAPWLLVALIGAAALVVAGPGPAVPVLVAGAGAGVAAGLVYSRRAPGAYLARYAELAELLVVLACVPVLVVVLGLLPVARGLGG
jgi:type VII secretion integral membrane protein EccD